MTVHGRALSPARAVKLAALPLLAGALAMFGLSATGGGRQAAAEQTVTGRPVTNRRLLVIGASYTQGLGARPQSRGYAYELGRELGWTTTVAGVAGTGFVNPGPQHDQTFGERVARLPANLDPGLVLIQCGRNDAGYPTTELRRAASATVSLVRRRYPSAELVMLGPIPGSAGVGQSLLDARSTLREVSETERVAFVDPIAEHWITQRNDRTYSGSVPMHPNNAGYAYIANRVRTDLQRLNIIAPAPAQKTAATEKPAAAPAAAPQTR